MAVAPTVLCQYSRKCRILRILSINIMLCLKKKKERKRTMSNRSVRCWRCQRRAAWSTCWALGCCCWEEQQSCADNTRKTFQVLIKSVNFNWRRTSGAFLDTFKTTTTTTTNSLYQESGKLLFPDEWVSTGYTLHPGTCVNAHEFSSSAIWLNAFWKCGNKYHCCCCCTCLCFYYYHFYFWFYKSNEIRKISNI